MAAGADAAAAGPPPPALRKETTRHPPSLRHIPPQAGDKVDVHYVAKLHKGGRVVASTKEKGDPISFKVGQGEVPPGWDSAVRLMRKGEHAKFLLTPSMAYGEAGDEALGVPPDSPILLEMELHGCPAREDLFEDGKALKLELKDSPNGRIPRREDEVQITLKVTVQGRGVVVSKEHLVYKMGSGVLGSLTRVVDKALSTMKRGEEAMVTCQPNFAFEDTEGRQCFVSLTLEEIYDVYDVSLGSLDRTVLRKRIKEGDGKGEKVHDTARVKVRVLNVVAGNDKVLSDPCEVSFAVGDGEVCDALEGSLVGMRVGEEAVLRCETVDSCAGGPLRLPAQAEPPIMVQIAVDEVEKVKEKWDLSSAERIERGRRRKETASELFKRGRIRLAAQHYENIAGLFAKLEFFRADDQERAEAGELRRVANLNRAMCMLKMGNLPLVKELCTTVLQEDPNNAKALFRRAKASLTLKEFDAATADLERLLTVEPASLEGRQLLKEARQLRKEHDRKESGTFARMCAGLGDMPERATKQDDIVTMPNLRDEIEKIADQHGLPLLKERAQGLERRVPPRVPEVAEWAAACGAEEDERGLDEGGAAPEAEEGGRQAEAEVEAEAEAEAEAERQMQVDAGSGGAPECAGGT